MGTLNAAGEGSNPNFSKRLVIIFKSCAVEVTQRTWRFLRNILVTLKLLHSSIFLSLTIQLNFLLFFSPLQRSIKKSISAFHKNLIKLGNKQKYLKAKFQISKLIEKHFLWFLVEWKDGGNNDDDEDGDVINDDDGGKIDCSLIYDLSRDSICQKRTIILLGPCIIKLIYVSF